MIQRANLYTIQTCSSMNTSWDKLPRTHRIKIKARVDIIKSF